jgi:hypothetical protein
MTICRNATPYDCGGSVGGRESQIIHENHKAKSNAAVTANSACMANGRVHGRSSGTRCIAARTTGVTPAQIHHEARHAAANRPMYACCSGDTGYTRTTAAPVSSPGIVHPASERSAARIRFTARIYRAAVTRASLVANRGHVQRTTRTGAERALPSPP